MKVVILCGGLGTRLREETEFRPKPMLPIGSDGKPILWHIMKYYAHFGHKEFILCLGYKGEVIKEFFRNYQWNVCSATIKLGPSQTVEYHNGHNEDDWKVTLLDTGANTMTGGRLQHALPYIEDHTFLMTYGDGLTDSNINASIDFHRLHHRLVTLTAVRPPGRFGDLEVQDGLVTAFTEKPGTQAGWINGGFFVMDKDIARYLTGEKCVLENEPMHTLAQQGQIGAFFHPGFWQCMDTYREQLLLSALWDSGKAPWRIWA